MGGADKCLLPLNGRPLLAHIVTALRPQCGDILINTNRDPKNFAGFGLPIRADAVPGHQGPLAGILTAMLWSRTCHPKAVHVLTVPGDTPFLPDDLVAGLSQSLATSGGDIAIARCDRRFHPTIGLWPVDLAEKLAHDLAATPVRSVHDWLNGFRVGEARFAAATLANLNTPEDLARASMLVA